MKKLIDFLQSHNIFFEENVSGAKLCSFRVGGNVGVLVKPRCASEVQMLCDFIGENKIKSILLGKGSNVVISDDGYDGAVISLSEISAVEISENTITVGAGASMFNLAVAAEKAELSGLEFAHGIPGSVGGGAYMNAGAYGGEMCQVITNVICYDRELGALLNLNNDECKFSYRHSIFQENKNLAILFVKLALQKGERSEIRAKMDEYKAKRVAAQPLEYPSAGSTFKRPEGHFAGKLIEDAGLKGFKIGGAQVSEKHAGFVINRGGATADDIKKIVGHIQKEVKEKFDVALECEIEFIE